MISVDSVENVRSSKRRINSKSKGRLVRSLEFDPKSSNQNQNQNQKQKSTRDSISRNKSSCAGNNNNNNIWRDPIKNVIHPAGFTTHKMSSVTNNFMSSDFNSSSSTSEIDEMVEDLVDPGSETLVFPQHDEVFRSSPLSTSSYNDNDNDSDNDHSNFYTHVDETINENDNQLCQNENNNCVGMSWNQKQNKWVPLLYRFVFPSSAFTPSTSNTTTSSTTTTEWSIKNGQLHQSQQPRASFKFPTPKKSIMMGPDGLLENKSKSRKVDSDARDVCEKLLELMDDENLMLPVLKLSPRGSSPPVSTSTKIANQPQKSLISDWSSLPSSPPPPIFHDICNRPIPELRLSPPMTGKSSIGKRLFPLNATINNYQQSSNNQNNNYNYNNSTCESPLTKRLRFSTSTTSSTESIS